MIKQPTEAEADVGPLGWSIHRNSNLSTFTVLSLFFFHFSIAGPVENEQVARDVRRKGAGPVRAGDKVRGQGASAEPPRHYRETGNLYSGQEPQHSRTRYR